MKFLSYRIKGEATYGAVINDRVVNLAARYPELPDLREAIRQNRLEQLGAYAMASAGGLDIAAIEFLPTIPNPEKIICIGVNYANRNVEYRDGSEAPGYPSVFMRARESIVGHGQPILDPPESDQLDYEGEIAIIIGKAGRRIPQSRACEHMAGLTIMNEGSVRDFLRHAKFNVTQGKNFANSGALGPWMITADELDFMAELQVITRVNGEERQNDVTSNLMFPFSYLISYLSTFYQLRPGDIIATGTPNGAGARFNPPRYLKDGDVVEVEAPGIGVLRNHVKTEIL